MVRFGGGILLSPPNMSHINVNTGYEYLFAKLHGLWGKSASGERLRKLIACVTEENLLRMLKDLGFPLHQHENFEKSLLLREVSLLQDFIALSEPATARFLRALLISICEENLKVLLHCRFFPEQANPIAEMLIPIPGAQPLLFEELLQVEDIEQFITLLPDEFSSPELAQVIRQLAKDKDIMAAECAIDALDFQRQFDCAGKMPLRVRKQARQVVGWEIDITNIIMLLRNLNMYHLTTERLDALWLNNGCYVSREQLSALGSSLTVEDAILGLPEPFSALLQQVYDSKELYHCEHALWNFLAQKVRMMFRNFNNPKLSILAFPYLLRFETINLARIYEGIRFGLPVKSIQSMMIGEA